MTIRVSREQIRRDLAQSRASDAIQISTIEAECVVGIPIGSSKVFVYHFNWRCLRKLWLGRAAPLESLDNRCGEISHKVQR